ncbi:AEC family transporter [Evansella sp. AB-P1]|uniref:AEC family transporter n=1 Tax=Evansella sp. AB-P1 TaxID=3037653 RepID=UPI00241D2D79|nr:AEC family transporter [Evansella sp. AB-P1]MDG5787543.1 AEC family transporter [Evansella sp. AB-P1]
MLFFDVVFPVLLVFIIGYVSQKWKRIDLKPISVLIIYILVPALVITTFHTTELTLDHGIILLYALIFLTILIWITKCFSWLTKQNSDTECGLILSTVFMNSGNYGVPIILFAFGQEGFAYAIIFMIVQTVIMSTFGIYYAAKGGTGIRTAIVTLLKLPTTYTIILVLALQWTNLKVPTPIFQTMDLISQATIPATMLLLGMQLAEIKLQRLEWGFISYGIFIRLLLSPILAWGITSLLPISPLMQSVIIILSATPSAATTTIYAIQFDTKPELVSSITLITTIGSVFTITGLLYFLL